MHTPKAPAMAEAERGDAGAVALVGKMIDIASIRRAKITVDKAKRVAANSDTP